jgi:hypothetical protein
MTRQTAVALLETLTIFRRGVFVVVLILTVGCKKEPAVIPDFTTPAGALLVLENAYRNEDVEAAVGAKCFEVEAKLMLRETMPGFATDDEHTRRLAEVLEMAFRDELANDGFPDFRGLTCWADSIEPYTDGVVLVAERCRFPDGGYSVQRMLVAETSKGWRVVNPLD